MSLFRQLIANVACSIRANVARRSLGENTGLRIAALQPRSADAIKRFRAERRQARLRRSLGDHPAL
ncbi:hypothetical protein KL86PLE_20176 [uncultured Pleomorphomonas sp.]|uniref:Uncharacterized protein n=1 Tax=uncultured Pleomorphomonas sp. TaxID=442121 RepID=A0A212LDF5_9HYPH|nr:hypothetical protein KL86PLE_20176 [uncultured Pleomorphomonas sp.]